MPELAPVPEPAPRPGPVLRPTPAMTPAPAEQAQAGDAAEVVRTPAEPPHGEVSADGTGPVPSAEPEPLDPPAPAALPTAAPPPSPPPVSTTPKATKPKVKPKMVEVRLAPHFAKGELRIGKQVFAITKTIDVMLPAGTHAMAWRPDANSSWRKAGRISLDPSKLYTVRLGPSGVMVSTSAKGSP